MGIKQWKCKNGCIHSSYLFLSILIVCNVWYGNRLAMQADRDRPSNLLLLPTYYSTRNNDKPGALPPPPSSSTGITHTLSDYNNNNYNNSFNFTIGICAIVKDMDAYLSEWLDYHLAVMNIDNIYIYDHSRQFYLKNWHDNTRNHPLYHRVHVLHWTHSFFPQGEAYTDCIMRFGRSPVITNYTRTEVKGNRLIQEDVRRTLDTNKGNDYIALIDGDEFLVPQGNYTSIHNVIEDYLEPYGGALAANWMLFGSANKTSYSPVPVTKRFQYRDEGPNGVIKTIVKASDFQAVRTPHSVSLQGDKLVRTTLYKGAISKEQFANVSRTGASDSGLVSTVLLVYHYRYLSEKEYNDKNCKRGHMAGKNECNEKQERTYTLDELKRMKKPEHIAIRPGTVFDDSAWRLLRDRVPKYQVFDDELAWGDYTQSRS